MDKESEYYIRRNKLLFGSFFLYQIVTKIRKELGIPSGSLRERHEWLLKTRGKMLKNSDRSQKIFQKEKWGHKSPERKVKESVSLLDEVEDDIFFPSISNIIDKYVELELSYELIKSAVLGYPSPLDSDLYLLVSTRKLVPGVYIKFRPDMSDKEMLRIKELAHKAYKNFMLMRGLPPLENELDIRRHTATANKNTLEVYEYVEQTYIRQYSLNKAKASLDETFRVVASQLKTKPTRISNIYYRVQRAYNLPSVTQASKLNS